MHLTRLHECKLLIMWEDLHITNQMLMPYARWEYGIGLYSVDAGQRSHQARSDRNTHVNTYKRIDISKVSWRSSSRAKDMEWPS